jgi:hypothetical protein
MYTIMNHQSRGKHHEFKDSITLPRSAGAITQSRTGSSYTCDPPVDNTDVDYLVLVRDLWQAVAALRDFGWTLCEGKDGSYEEDDTYSLDWYAVRKGNLNLILTGDPRWYQRAVQATTICKKHNVLDKDDRIIVFRWVRDGGGPVRPRGSAGCELEVDERVYHSALARWPL